MSLRDELTEAIAQACSHSPTDDLSAMSNSMGYASGLCEALRMAQQHGVADGEDWKTKYEAADRLLEDRVNQLNQFDEALDERDKRIAELESQLARFVPDVPEEGLDEVA